MKLRISGMTAGLAVGITTAVVTACAAGAWLFSLHHFDSLVQTARAGALAQGELMRAALEHQMIENDRSLIARMVETFGRQPDVENVAILDRSGTVRFTSKPLPRDNDLTPGSPTCQVCHRVPAAQREASQIVETRGGAVLRTVIPVRNRQACYGCHDPSHRLNGILMLDINASGMRAAMNRDLRWMVLGTAAVMLLLIAGIAVIVRVFVLRRLQRFETTARCVAAGDLQRRVPVDGSDTISWLAREFNTMADSMTGLVADVRTERERLERVINSVDDGIVVLDRSRKVIAANDAFIERTRHARGDVLGCQCRDIASGLCSAGDCPTVACVRSGQRQVRLSERIREDGSTVWEEIHASPIRGPSGAITQVVEVWRDISDRRAAEARLAESHRLVSVGVLASGFSHEMNTPLATVLACVEGILRDAKTAEGEPMARVAESAAIARDQILRCRGITQHFLRLSRGQPSAGTLVDLGATISAVVRLIDPTARAHGVHVDIDVPDGVHVHVDEAELQHTVMNLVLNAVQACAADGRVRVEVERGDEVLIRVTDNGCGIPPVQQKRIFEPFFSLREGGTGLGLFLSLNFVRRWGGDLTVVSSPGVGSTFEVRLPLAAEGHAA